MSGFWPPSSSLATHTNFAKFALEAVRRLKSDIRHSILMRIPRSIFFLARASGCALFPVDLEVTFVKSLFLRLPAAVFHGWPDDSNFVVAVARYDAFSGDVASIDKVVRWC